MSIDPTTHLSWILEHVTPTAVRELAIEDALGAVLAQDACAAHPLPLWANSAMDGYAVRSADVAEASASHPAELRVLGEVTAGSPWDPPLERGEAVRIMTGAPVPSDTDAVVRVERTSGGWAEHTVRVIEAVSVGADIRESGEDLRAGDLVASAGDRLTAQRASALAAAGVWRVAVRTEPRVAVIVTGAELQRGPEAEAGSGGPGGLGASPVRGMIPESNSLLMRGLLNDCGIRGAHIEHCLDDAGALRGRIDALAQRFDAIITTGGIGPGTHDVVGSVLDAEPDVRAVRLALRPAKHQRAGRLPGGAFIFALPGNPVSAAVSFELFVRPALRAMQGDSQVHRPRLAARAEVGWRGRVGSLQVLPVRCTALGGEALGDRGADLAGDAYAVGGEPGLRCAPAVHSRRISHSVGGFGTADGYALVGPERGDVAAGELVTVIRTTE